MKRVLIAFVSFIKQLFLRLCLVITLNIGRNKENESEHSGDEESTERED